MVPQGINNIPSLFMRQVKKYGNKACVSHRTPSGWEDISWEQMAHYVIGLASFLAGMGVRKGDKVGIFAPNRYEWWVSDLAILSLGAVDVPIYATNSPEEARYILWHSEAVGCIVGKEEHFKKLLLVRDQLPGLRFVICMDPQPEDHEAGIYNFQTALSLGQGVAFDIEAHIQGIEMDDLATIMYTSGTTGPPKGVMLSHGNFLNNVYQALHDYWDQVFETDVLLSFLPLSHSLERTAGYYMPMAWGAKVAFAQDFANLPQDLLDIRPTCIVSVPRLYEKIHGGVLAKVAKAPPKKQRLFYWAMDMARQNLPYVCENRNRKGLFALKYLVADKLVFSKLKKALGLDRLRFAVSGGGPLSVGDAEFFLGMGIVILEGYGLTETTPITNVNRYNNIRPGTVGPPVPGTTIKISPEGEILIKGPQVMKGYYKDEQATKEVFTEDGFFRTGDVGRVDGHGYLVITDRLKEIIITSGGKNIAPQNIENRLKESRFIEQVAVIGDRRKYLSALIVPNFEQLEAWAKEKGIGYGTREDLVNNPMVLDLYQKEIQQLMDVFARVEQIKKFTLLPNEWTQATGELTPTMKLKRRVINQKYRDLIEAMYPKEF